MLSDRVIERLIVYRRLLREWILDGSERIYSHELAQLAGVTPAQVRRDIMAVACAGNPARGYVAEDLADQIGQLLHAGESRRAALIGVGHLGQALMAYFNRRSAQLSIVAGFDVDPAKAERVLHGCHCYHLDRLEEIIARDAINVAILAVPATAAANVTARLVSAGIHGILNLTPVRLRAREGVFVEDVDLAISLEKVAFFAGVKQPVTDGAEACQSLIHLPAH